MDFLESLWNAIFESGVDRFGVGGACRFLLPKAHPYLAKAWRRIPRIVASFKKATPLQKQIIGTWALGIIPITIGGVMGAAAPLWAIVWLVSVMLALAVGIGYAYLRATLRPNRPLA